MKAIFWGTMTIRGHCIECQRETEQTFTVFGGQDLPIVGPPEGWSVLNGNLICDQHVIEVKATPRPIPSPLLDLAAAVARKELRS